MLAYDYPLLGVFWSVFIFSMFFLWIFTVAWCFIDNLRRHDHHGMAKAMWFLALVFIPIAGVLAYVISRPNVTLEPVATVAPAADAPAARVA